MEDTENLRSRLRERRRTEERRKATEKEKREVLRLLMMIDVNENAGERVRGRQP